jgi:hypothetical protein
MLPGAAALQGAPEIARGSKKYNYISIIHRRHKKINKFSTFIYL